MMNQVSFMGNLTIMPIFLSNFYYVVMLPFGLLACVCVYVSEQAAMTLSNVSYM